MLDAKNDCQTELIKFLSIPNVLFFFWIVGPLALDILNTFWFYKMFRGMLKALQVHPYV